MPENNDFDFSDFVFGENHDFTFHQEPETFDVNPISSQSQVKTSYILVNALLEILLKKEIISPEELQPILSELHQSYYRKGGA